MNVNTDKIIDESRIKNVLDGSKESSKEEVRGILKKALELKGLELEESACLLNIDEKDEGMLEELFNTAFKIKNSIYGNRLVLFAPLYVSNHCTNDCLYCGFRKSNNKMVRRILSEEEVKEEIRIIEGQGHKRILMLIGDDPERYGFDDLLCALKAAYSVKEGKGEIRRINVEIPPLSVEDFKRLKEAKIGTFTMFQETYHEETYKRMHPTGKKSDYRWRLEAMDRAQEAGIDDVGIGALFGLYDYRFEVLALLMHSRHLEQKFGTGPHTISIPRIEPAQNAPIANNPAFPVSDTEFKKLISVIRCSVPYTGMILSTRESPEMRKEAFHLGVSQVSAGSKTSPGGYNEARINPEDEEQFALSDTRPTPIVIKDMMEQGFIPSFCTGCYRRGRTGKDFMDLAKPGLIQRFCQPNALLTLQEYLEDYGDSETKEAGKKLIEKEALRIRDERIRKAFYEKLERVKDGEKDLYF
ncbi:[FeFe] hydrogenase H-cluster radical SAM maturase HydG [Candidatus Woesearchaeota archaeon]|nr:[FeFe] hydrogenase H-cluster radical SAM maturase HydG [Candidatus Woesearchaeota archaeon]